MGKAKQINIKNRTYYFYNDMVNIKKFDPNLLNIDKIAFKTTNVVIYNITVNINHENPLYLSFNYVDGYIEESNGDK